LFQENGLFYVMLKIDFTPLAELFRANVLKMLKKEGKIDDGLVVKLLTWKNNSGFSVHNGGWLARDDENGRESLARYIIRNPFSVKKVKRWKEYGRRQPSPKYILFVSMNRLMMADPVMKSRTCWCTDKSHLKR
jgi:hypothetical protein